MPLRFFRLAALLLSLLALAPAPASAAAPDPAAFVTSIYAHGREESVWTQLLAHGKRGAWVSRDLAALWDKCDALARKSKDEMGALDADVLTNSQMGWEAFKGFGVSVVSQTDGRAVVEAKLQVGPNTSPPKVASDNVIRFSLVSEGGAWRIDDVSSTVDGKGWALRDMLKDYLKGTR